MIQIIIMKKESMYKYLHLLHTRFWLKDARKVIGLPTLEPLEMISEEDHIFE